MKKLNAGLLVVLSAATVLSMTGCKNKNNNDSAEKHYTYRSYTSVMPSNWNLLDYEEENDLQILDYIHSPLFEYDFKFDDNGKVIPGEFETEYAAVTKLEDVSENFAGQYGIPDDDDVSGYAWKLTLRNDLKWDDGTPIHADDFVYSMKEQLNPDFGNYRANSYYQNASNAIFGAKYYFYQGKEAFESSVMSVVGYKDLRTDLTTKDDVFGVLDDSGDIHRLSINLRKGLDWSANGPGLYDHVAAGYAADYALEKFDGEWCWGYWALDAEEEDVVVFISEDGERVFDVEGNELAFGDGEITTKGGDHYSTMPGEGDDVVTEIPDAFWDLYNASDDNYELELTTPELVTAVAEVISCINCGTSNLEYYNEYNVREHGEEYEGYAYVEWSEMVACSEIFSSYDWDNVGIFADKDNQDVLYVVFGSPSYLLTEEGDLSYRAAYYMGQLPLVKKDLYESCKVAPTAGNSLWSSTYCMTLATTASWGPYKLTAFQDGKEFTLEKNPNWFGFTANLYPGQYQTEKIITSKVEKWETAWLLFKQGLITSIGIDTSISADYANSSQGRFAPSTFTSSMQIISSRQNMIALTNERGKNHMMCDYVEFREAISLACDRAEFARTCTTSSRAQFGLLNNQYYYDVENGGCYTETQAYKEMICSLYDIDWNAAPYNGDIDKAVAAITGTDMNRARELVTEAYNKAKDAGDVTGDPNERFEMIIINGSSDASTTRISDFEIAFMTEMLKGTPLEGKYDFVVVDKGNNWWGSFAAGEGDLLPTGGWQGSALSPDGILSAYTDPESEPYAYAWDADTVYFEAEVGGETYNLSVYEWNQALLGGNSRYDFSEGSGNITTEERVKIMTLIEKEVLKTFYSIPLWASYSSSLQSFQVSYITDQYNYFVGFGGIRYMTYNYTDAEWADFVASKGGDLGELYKQ